jgi:hypothetical protein
MGIAGRTDRLVVGRNVTDWTEAVQVTNTDDRPDLPSEGAPDIDKTVNVKQKLISGHEPQMGLDAKMDWSTDRRSYSDFDFELRARERTGAHEHGNSLSSEETEDMCICICS